MLARGTDSAYQLNVAIVVPRECAKTTLITQAGQMWCHLQDADLSTYTGSETMSRAAEFLSSNKMVLTGVDPYSRFAWLYGNWGVDGSRRWKTDGIVHSARKNVSRKEHSMGTWGVEQGLTGTHPDMLFFDDPTSYEKMAAHLAWLEIVNNHVTSLIPVVKGDGANIWVGTRYHDGDHFGTAFRLEGVQSIAGMALPDFSTSPNGKWHVYFLQGRHPDGKPSIPHIWSDKRMKEYERKDPLRYAAQIMNDPSSSEFNPLTRAQADQCFIAPNRIPWRRLSYTIHMDTAFKSQDRQARGDESVIQVWGHSRDGSGNVYYKEGYSSNIWRAEDFCQKIVLILQKLKAEGLRVRMMTDEIEPGGKRGTWEMVVQSFCASAGVICPPMITLLRGGRRKTQRMITAASYWVDAHVFLPSEAPGTEKLIDQMTRIGSSAHDDWADCAADVFHVDVYNVMHRLGGEQEASEAPPVNPWDDVLKPQYQINDATAMRYYDTLYPSSDEWDAPQPV